LRGDLIVSIKISVIIPVYNAEKFIAQCIESLLVQTLEECEFIFINDGSTDSSLNIINKFQKVDSRIKLIEQKNQGVSIARNQGLKVAKGEYIGFVDADDYIEKDMFEQLYTTAKVGDYDVVITNFESELSGTKIAVKYHFPMNEYLTKGYIDEEILPYLLKSNKLNAIWNKIYKNKIIKENKIEFPIGMALGEDGIFNIKFFCYSKKVYYKNYSGYHYREVQGSATRNILQKDYFQKALETYGVEISEINEIINNRVKINTLKSIKLIQTVISLIHVYLNPSKELSFLERYLYVKKMICNKTVRESLPLYFKEYKNNLGKYETLILKFIKYKFPIGLYVTTAYSRYRNKS
jgi:glycosyltransferase involved in cell wall biosynthesis